MTDIPEGVPDGTDLSLASTDDLCAELRKRFDALLVAGMRWQQVGSEQVELHYKNRTAALGLLRIAERRIIDAV